MRYATGRIGERVEAYPGARAQCPTCGAAVLAKCGQITSWHWAHAATGDCDPWSESETTWHRDWQGMVPPERREVVIGCHRADMVTPDGTVVELQHSYLPADQTAAREAHYGRMIWIFDATQAYDENRIWIRKRDGYVTFRWKHPRKSVSLCTRPTLLDLGPYLLLIKKIHTAAPCGGWGRIVDKDDMARSLNSEQVTGGAR